MKKLSPIYPKKLRLIKKTRNIGIKYYDIYDTCFTKKELIKEYDYFKNKEYKETKTDVFKKFTLIAFLGAKRSVFCPKKISGV